MSNSHSRKQRARRRQKRTGAGYASAAAGTAHRHRGPDIPPIDGSLFGRPGPVRMDTVGRLVGACMDGCAPCQQSLTDRVLDGDRVAAASLIGLVLGSLPAAPRPISCAATCAVYPLASNRGDEGVRALIAHPEKIDRAELADVLSDTLDFVPEFVDMLAQSAPAAEPDGRPDLAPEPGTQPRPRGTAKTVGDDASAITPVDPSPFAMPFATYYVTAGIDLFLTDAEVRQLLRMAEATADGAEPLECWLCDQPIDMAAAPQVNLGLAVSASVPGDDAGDLLEPVWTHVDCGRPRVWTLVQLNAARGARGLPTWGDDPAPAIAPGERERDWFTSSLVDKAGTVLPLLVIQPGEPNRWGTPGHLTDMISMGLRPVDLHRGRVEEVPSWQVRMDRGRVAEITRQGAGRWWVADAGTGSVDGQWRRGGRARRQAVVVILPPRWLTDDQQDPTAGLLEACAQELAYGGLMQLRGTFS